MTVQSVMHSEATRELGHVCFRPIGRFGLEPNRDIEVPLIVKTHDFDRPRLQTRQVGDHLLQFNKCLSYERQSQRLLIVERPFAGQLLKLIPASNEGSLELLLLKRLQRGNAP